jgi:hypothetical protein
MAVIVYWQVALAWQKYCAGSFVGGMITAYRLVKNACIV